MAAMQSCHDLVAAGKIMELILACPSICEDWGAPLTPLQSSPCVQKNNQKTTYNAANPHPRIYNGSQPNSPESLGTAALKGRTG